MQALCNTVGQQAFLKAPEVLLQALYQVIPDTGLSCQRLPDAPIDLWLIPPDLPTGRMDDEVVRRIWNDTPYWIFCWASGLAMAQWLLTEQHHIKDKVVLDFGAGSGVVAIAAKMAGAKRVIACDIDPISLIACRENARLNQVELEYLDDLYALSEQVDVLLAADVLYDQSNRFFLDEFLRFGKQVWVADSRVKNFVHPAYQKIDERSASTWPDLDEAKEFRNVSFYRTLEQTGVL
jgi:predicted nicotinamide N-methyase